MVELPNPAVRHRAALRTMQAERAEVQRHFDNLVAAGEDATDQLQELRRLDAAIADTLARVEAVERVEHARKSGEADKAKLKRRQRLEKQLAGVEDKAEAFEAAMVPALKAWRVYVETVEAMDADSIASGIGRHESRTHRQPFVWSSVMGRFLRDAKQPAAEALRQSAETKTLAEWFGRKRAGAFAWLKPKSDAVAVPGTSERRA